MGTGSLARRARCISSVRSTWTRATLSPRCNSQLRSKTCHTCPLDHLAISQCVWVYIAQFLSKTYVVIPTIYSSTCLQLAQDVRQLIRVHDITEALDTVVDYLERDDRQQRVTNPHEESWSAIDLLEGKREVRGCFARKSKPEVRNRSGAFYWWSGCHRLATTIRPVDDIVRQDIHKSLYIAFLARREKAPHQLKLG